MAKYFTSFLSHPCGAAGRLSTSPTDVQPVGCRSNRMGHGGHGRGGQQHGRQHPPALGRPGGGGCAPAWWAIPIAGLLEGAPRTAARSALGYTLAVPLVPSRWVRLRVALGWSVCRLLHGAGASRRRIQRSCHQRCFNKTLALRLCIINHNTTWDDMRMTLEAGERVRYRRRATGPRAAAMFCTCAGPPWAAWGPLLGPENMTKRDIAAARPA